MRQYLLTQVFITSLFFSHLQSFSQNVVTVTDCNLNGWIKQPIGNSSLGFINGPSTPPLGKGSLKFSVPEGGIFFPGDFVRFRNGQFSGTPLSSLTELSYSTFVEARDTLVDIHFLVILVDINGDGAAEHNLVFDPRYQRPPFINGTMPNQGISHENVWQTWDAFHGGWFFGGEVDTDPDHNGPFFTLPEYLALFPNATIRNDPAKGGPAIRLTAGGVVFKPNFFGAADNFKIGINGVTTTYDFEFMIADAGTDKSVVYGYGSNCITLSGTASGGVAPYTYSWSSGANTRNAQVCPVTTATYTLAVADANGCIGTDDLVVSANDVRCGDQMNKVKLCHNGEEICISPDAVTAHLNHGDVLGSCSPSSITKSDIQTEEIISGKVKLLAFPNAFSGSTRIQYELPFDANTSIRLYDISGREIKNLLACNEKKGSHSFNFFSSGLQKGIYYCKLIVVGKNGMSDKAIEMIVIN